MKKEKIGSVFIVLFFVGFIGLVFADEYAYTQAYFNIPSDVSFKVSLPGDGVPPYESSETSPGTATAWISFNTTGLPATDVQPWTLGVDGVANRQDGSSQPIFYVENFGNTRIDFHTQIASLDPCLDVCANSTCGDGLGACTGATFYSTCSDIEGVEQIMVNELDFTSGSNHVNITLYGSFGAACIPGEYGPYQISHRSTAD